MSDFNISIPGGESLRLLTGGKYCPADIIVESPPAPVEKDINFWDYDGTLLYSYTLAEMQALTELPPNAEHEGLIGEGWNWSLEGLKENNGPLDVVALYVTNDNATWFDFVNDLGRDVTVTFRWKQAAANDGTIDFGDGSALYSTASTGDVEVQHTYSPGQYRAKISGNINLRGVSNGCCVSDIASGGSSLLRRVFLGRIGYLYAYSFLNCFKLESISMPYNFGFSGVQIFNGCIALKIAYTSIRSDIVGTSSGIFNSCYNVQIVSFSENTVSAWDSMMMIKRAIYSNRLTFDNLAFPNNEKLTVVKITDITTVLKSRAFQSCNSLLELTVPASVQTIQTYCFNTCKNLRVLRFEGATPPTVANSNAFNSFPTDCIIEVPAVSLAAYQSATNYGTIAAQMVGV